MNFAGWVGATRCTSGPQPGAVAMLAWLRETDPAGWSGGIYNCRSVAGTSTTSTHGEGRAVDWMKRVVNGRGSAEGRRLVATIGAHGHRLGVQTIIYDRTIWSARSPGGRRYTGAHPHNDHLHVELTPASARNLTLATLRSVLGGDEGQVWVPPIHGHILADGGRLFNDRGGAHKGVDIHAPRGRPVRAVAGGRVSHATRGDISGHWIGIAHADGTTSRYHHLNRRGVQVGATVSAGQVIGECGDTGRAGSGPHLHIERRRTRPTGNPWDWPALDPANRLPGQVRAGAPYPGPIEEDDMYVVKYGDGPKDPRVRRAQNVLQAAGEEMGLGGVLPEFGIDGHYGDETARAVDAVAGKMSSSFPREGKKGFDVLLLDYCRHWLEQR